MAVGTTVAVLMPKMGDSVTEGTVLEWHRSEGEHVSAGETIVEISTDKVDAEVAAPASGTLVRILAPEGEVVAVGVSLAEIAADENGMPAHDSASSGPAAATDPWPDGPTATAPNGTAAAAMVDIVTPAAGESVTEGTLLGWTVAVGDRVKEGDTVVEISTDKVDVELPAPASGTITELLAGEGDTVTVGQVIGRMAAGAAPPATAPRRPRPLRRPPPRPAPSPRLRPARPRRRPPSRGAPPPRWRSTSARSPEPASPGGSSRRTCSMPPPGTPAPPRRPPRRPPCSRPARRCSPSTWTRAARSPPRRPSARSSSTRSMAAAGRSRRRERRSPSPT